MKLSTKARYAVTAMADLAGRGSDLPVTLGEIAESQEISQAYLEQLFAKMRKSGLVNSVRGPGGGYTLSRIPGEIRISDIVVAVDEPMKVTSCNLDEAKGCIRSGRCITHDLWEELGRHLHLFMASVTLADIIENRVLGLAGNVPFATQDRAAQDRAAQNNDQREETPAPLAKASVR